MLVGKARTGKSTLSPRPLETKGCPWLECNAWVFPRHRSAAALLQAWFRRGRKQTFKRYIRTKEFNEWIYGPEQIGGKMVKRDLRECIAGIVLERKDS